MLGTGLATAALAVPLLAVLIFAAPAAAFGAVVGAIAVLGVAEYGRMVFPVRRRERLALLVCGAVMAAGMAVEGGRFCSASLTAVVVGGLLWVLWARRDFSQGLTDLGHVFVGVLYSAYLLPHFVWLHGLPAGRYWVAFVVATVMIGDSAGYFAGSSWGRHPLAPSVSPRKTVEGATGVLAGNLIAAAAAKLAFLPQVGWIEALLLAVVLGVLGQLGDLCESMMKRTHGTKESGGFFPGHGGVLDRTDSLVFPAAAMYYYVSLCR